MPEVKKTKVIVIGAGSRGTCYPKYMLARKDARFEIVAVAEPIEDRRNNMKALGNIPDEMCFESWEPLFSMPKIADVALIATMDRDHIAPALAAIEKGYNLLLEKPAGATAEECRRIQHAAEEKGVFVLVCHVLRYTDFWCALKCVIDSGELGEVMNIQHVECVGNLHQSHSFVRGNWRNSEESSPMILQKTCHDMDILAWLLGKKCTRVQSFGSLSYFVRENAPEGSPEYCIEGCPVGEECPYNAVKVYYDDKKNDWFRTTCTRLSNPTDADVERAIRTTDYGKCVFKCPNNVVDRQVVNLEFEGGALVSFTMSAFNKGGRTIRIMGTKGELSATMGEPIIKIYSFETKSYRELDLNAQTADNITGGHGGGDAGIVSALCDIIDGVPNSSVCDIRESCDNHMISFAAEESRLTGKVVDMKEFMSRYC